MSLAEASEQPRSPEPLPIVLNPEPRVELKADPESTPAPLSIESQAIEEPKVEAVEGVEASSVGKTAAKSPKIADDSSTKPKKAPRKRDRKSTAKRAKKPSKIIKLRMVNTEPAPVFQAVQIPPAGLEVFWLRVQLREFLLRFDKLCRIPTRYLNYLNDITGPWIDQLYKSVIVALFRLFSYDKSWLIPLAKQYLPLVEECNAESSQLWTLLYDFLVQIDPYATNADSLSGEHYRMELIRRLMVQVSATDTIRSTVINDHEALQQLKKENLEQIKQFQDQYTAKLDQLKLNKETYAEKKANAERITGEKIFKAEQLMYSRLRKYSLRTSPLGMDNFGNTYWILQQKGKELWGTSILCEMKVFPDDEELMVLREPEPEPEPNELELKDETPLNGTNGNGDASTNGSVDANGANGTPTEPKRKRRRYVVPKREYLTDREPTINHVSGQENILTLAGWIRGQIGPKQETLATEIETISYYCCG